MTQHTPTPWSYDGRDIWATNSGNAVNVARLLTPKLAEANAAFIVKAVNSHAALVEALKAAQSYIETPGDLSRPEVTFLQEDIEIALKLATE